MAAEHIHYQGNDIYYTVQGVGPTIVFLHGWRQRKETWSSLMEYFTSRGYQCVALDLPGFGQSHIESVWNIHDYAKAIIYVLHQLHISNCILLGHSFGGKCAIAVTARERGLVSKLVLSSTNLTHGAGKLSIMRRLIRWTLQLGLSEVLHRTFANTHNIDLTPMLQRLYAPVLLIYGTYDFIAPVSQGKFISEQVSQATIVTLPAWHLSYREHPSRFVRQLEAFFKN